MRTNGRVERVDEVKGKVKTHFENFFKNEESNRAVPEGLPLKSLCYEDKTWLQSLFTEKEIYNAVWDCDGKKSPGLDGLMLELFQKCWETVKGDVFIFVKDFHEKKLIKSCTSSFLVLIPESKNPQTLSE